jgi:ABC-type bacteriocin/lantibiotic exporter with double-glycine peptidase domain
VILTVLTFCVLFVVFFFLYRLTVVSKPQLEEATNFALISIANIRTLHILGKEKQFMAKYDGMVILFFFFGGNIKKNKAC